MAFQNNPHGANTENEIRRWEHTPLTIDHYGIQASIQANGKVKLVGNVANAVGDEVEFDEIEIPASLIFKLASLLKATRKVVYVKTVAEKETD